MTSFLSSNKRWLQVLLLVLSGLGFADATYLTISHYTGAGLACRIFDGCDTVTTSAYSMIGPIPVALLGLLFYLTVLSLTVAWGLYQKPEILRAMGLLTLVGFLFTLYFVSLQLFVIAAICLYCMISATLSTLIFISTAHLKKKAA